MRKGFWISVCLVALALLMLNLSIAQFGLINLVKSGGAFAAADMQGTWYAYSTGSGVFSVDNFGTITSGAAYIETGAYDNVTRGSFNLNGSGNVTGNVTWVSGVSTSHQAGKMDANKELTVATFTESDGDYGYWVSLKGGGVFATADLQGTWYFQGYNSSGSAFAG